jgi:hypothetical protein
MEIPLSIWNSVKTKIRNDLQISRTDAELKLKECLSIVAGQLAIFVPLTTLSIYIYREINSKKVNFTVGQIQSSVLWLGRWPFS